MTVEITKRAVEKAAREHWGYLYACLVKQFNEFDLAEDALQDAIIKALETWPNRGIPDSPCAWLLQTAKRKALDRLRRRHNFDSKKDSYALLIKQSANESIGTPEQLADENIEDERLRLIFTCCHPSLPETAHVALTLRTLGGLSVPEIARAFLVPETTLAQRLVRAKNKIRQAGIPYKVPDTAEYPERIKSVLSVIYLIFNEGHTASDGGDMLRTDLCNEAIHLAQMLNLLTPNEPEVMGLLALLLLHDSRRDSRFAGSRHYLPLQTQDRSLWDKNKITQGKQLLTKALSMGKLGCYQLQAAISAVHSDAKSFMTTDWTQIRFLYNRLYEITPSPIISLNSIVALSYEQSAEVALEAMLKVDLSTLIEYQPYHAARADLLSRANQTSAACAEYELAINYSQNKQEKAFLKDQLAQILETKR
jgi:RNA polymerase sigma-70 factor (ECF subfamily)